MVSFENLTFCKKMQADDLCHFGKHSTKLDFTFEMVQPVGVKQSRD